MGDCKRRRNRVCSLSRDGSQRRELHKWTQPGKKVRRRLGVFLRTCVVTVSPGFHLVLVYASYRQCGKDVNQKKCVLKYTKLSETHERKITLYRQCGKHVNQKNMCFEIYWIIGYTRTQNNIVPTVCGALLPPALCHDYIVILLFSCLSFSFSPSSLYFLDKVADARRKPWLHRYILSLYLHLVVATFET